MSMFNHLSVIFRNDHRIVTVAHPARNDVASARVMRRLLPIHQDFDGEKCEVVCPVCVGTLFEWVNNNGDDTRPFGTILN